MPTISPTYMYDVLGKKQKQVNEDRLKQAAKLNMLGNVFNLIGQAAYGTKGATIIPMQDKVTPFVLNEFNKQRQMDIMEGEKARAFQLQRLLEDEKRMYNEARDQEKVDRAERIRQEDIARRENENKTYRPTIEEQKEIAGIRAGQEVDTYEKKKKIDQKYPDSKDDTNYVFQIGQTKLTKQDVASLSPIINELANRPDIKERLKKRSPVLPISVKFELGKLSDDETAIVLSELWPEIEAEYKKLKGSESKPETKSTPKEKIIW